MVNEKKTHLETFRFWIKLKETIVEGSTVPILQIRFPQCMAVLAVGPEQMHYLAHNIPGVITRSE
jgi:hypothetical protein